LEAEFGSAVGQLVVEMTDDKSLPKAERKRLQIEHAPHASPEGTLVKQSDKICNVRDMIGPPPGWDLERQREYFDWAKAVVDRLPRANAKLLALFEEAYRAKP